MGQSGSGDSLQESADQTLVTEELSLLSELRSLNEQATNLPPLSRGLVKMEIADAVWMLDREWAKALLVKAYELTLPDEAERAKLRNTTVGARPTLPLSVDRARRNLRSRVMKVAAREKTFADELFRLGLEQLGSSEQQMMYASLAENARQERDLDAAARYLLQSVDSDPSQIAAGFILVDIAKTDRATADRLIVEYVNRLGSFPLSRNNGSIIRIFLVLHKLVFPTADTAPPSVAVMRAYVTYVLQSLSSLEEREPGSLADCRWILLRAWLPLKHYAPELTANFLVLERFSRGPNDTASLPPGDRTDNQKRTKEKPEDDQPNEITISRAIASGDFAKARKLIDKLIDGPEKTQLLEMANAKEVRYLLNRGEFDQARHLATQLKRASSIREVYPALIGKCVLGEDETCATSLMLQAMKQLKTSDPTPWQAPAGNPNSTAATSREFDPILDGMAKLTLAVFPISFEIALIGLSETIATANVSAIDTGEGRPGLDVNLFKKLASKDELRVRQQAESFKDPLRRIVSLAAICQWKAADLDLRVAARAHTQQKARP